MCSSSHQEENVLESENYVECWHRKMGAWIREPYCMCTQENVLESENYAECLHRKMCAWIREPYCMCTQENVLESENYVCTEKCAQIRELCWMLAKVNVLKSENYTECLHKKVCWNQRTMLHVHTGKCAWNRGLCTCKCAQIRELCWMLAHVNVLKSENYAECLHM